MLLTITYTGKQTQNLGYLLHKNPYRAQSFDLSFGHAYVFYPEVSDEITTAALLLDINPIDLARGKLGTRDGGLRDIKENSELLADELADRNEILRYESGPAGDHPHCKEQSPTDDLIPPGGDME